MKTITHLSVHLAGAHRPDLMLKLTSQATAGRIDEALRQTLPTPDLQITDPVVFQIRQLKVDFKTISDYGGNCAPLQAYIVLRLD